MMKGVIFLAILIAAALVVQTRPIRVVAVANPLSFSLKALLSGWNATTTPNPALTEFRGVSFTTKAVYGNDGLSHIFAIYTNGTTPDLVDFTNCLAPCLARATQVDSTHPNEFLTFTPAVPPDDRSGVGGYEYYCQFHPVSMHGHIKVFKSPDFDPDHLVDIVDVAKVAFAFGSAFPSVGRWNATLDLNNDGAINILDVAVVAFYFGQPV